VKIAEQFDNVMTCVKQKLVTVGDLLAIGEIVRNGNKLSIDGGTTLETIHDENATVGIAKYKRRGDTYVEHVHMDSIQYIIQIKGKVGVTMSGGYRILETGACMSIPMGVPHSVYALEDDSMQVYINIPAEKYYSRNRSLV